MYYYTHNGQGDIIGIIDSNGTVVVRYTYDAWGKLLSTTGTKAGTIGSENPFRYRGYFYDSSTGLYNCLSRYYDPVTGRFLNADVYASTGQGFTGYNMYAYCNNNSINLSDPSGCAPVINSAWDAKRWWNGGLNATIGYSSADAAAEGFAYRYRNASDYLFLEMSAPIYSKPNSSGQIRYHYAEVLVGNPHDAGRWYTEVPDGTTLEAHIHTPPRICALQFSKDDANGLDQRNLSGYLVDREGSLHKRMPGSGTDDIGLAGTILSIGPKYVLTDLDKSNYLNAYGINFSNHFVNGLCSDGYYDRCYPNIYPYD